MINDMGLRVRWNSCASLGTQVEKKRSGLRSETVVGNGETETPLLASHCLTRKAQGQKEEVRGGLRGIRGRTSWMVEIKTLSY